MRQRSGSLASLWRGRGAGWRRRDGNVNDRFFTGFDYDVLERIAANDREVAVVFVFVEERGVGLVQADAIRARGQ